MSLVFGRLSDSPNSLGLAAEFVARYPPFVTYEFGPMVRTLLFQLERQTHLVGTIDEKIVAYLGWMRTSPEIAERWINEDGKLRPDPRSDDAVAVTVFAVADPKHSLAMIRKAKTIEAGRSVYWKRYFTTGKEPSNRAVRKKR